MATIASIVLILGWVPFFPQITAQTNQQTHAAITIDGDADLCNTADVRDGIDIDGIINCLGADGSAEAPFILRGWSIERDPLTCVPGLSLCEPLPSCSSSQASAAVAICNTTKHILIESLTIYSQQAAGGLTTPETQARRGAGLLLSSASNVTVRSVNVSSDSLAILVEEGTHQGSEGRATAIEFIDVGVFDMQAGGQSSSLAEALLEVDDADTRFVRLNVGPNARPETVVVRAIQDLDESPLHRVEFVQSTFRGGQSATLAIRDHESRLLHNTFHPTLVQSPARPTSPPSLLLEYGDTQTLNNTFHVETVAVVLQSIEGRLQFNRFLAQGNSPSMWAIYRPGGGECLRNHLTYNDFNGLAVANDHSQCTLAVPHNYWAGEPKTGGADPINLDGTGSVDTQPTLPHPIDRMPAVRILSPSTGTGVHGRFLIHGTAEARDGGSLQRVEATPMENVWTENVTAEGLDDWLLTWDATSEPLGPLQLWVRACAADGCGVPATVSLTIVERPQPPIALLDATPRLARVGDIVTLNARASYSPQARPITLFRFDLGNGVRTDWAAASTYDVRYNQAGEYPASVEVLDASGLQNTNLPQAIVRIRGDDDAGRDAGPIPSASTLATATALVATLLVLRRRSA